MYSHGDREASDKTWFSKEILSFTVNTIGNRTAWFFSYLSATSLRLICLLYYSVWTKFTLRHCWPSACYPCEIIIFEKLFERKIESFNTSAYADSSGTISAYLQQSLHSPFTKPYKTFCTNRPDIWCGHAERNFLERFWNFPQKTFSQIYYLAKAVSSLILSEMAGRKQTASFM